MQASNANAETTLRNEYLQYATALNDPDIVEAIEAGELTGVFERMVVLKHRLNTM